MSRWPKTKHWRRVESTFRASNGSGWRTAAAVVLGCDKRDLRGIVDRDLSPVEIKALDARLINHLHRFAVDLQEHADYMCNLARWVMRATNEVSLHTHLEMDRVVETIDIDLSAAAPEITYGPLQPWQQAFQELLEDA